MDEMKFNADTKQDREEIAEETKKKRFDFATMEINSFFDNIIKKNQFVREKDFGNGFVIKVKPLNVGELIEAEAIIRNGNPKIPIDTMVKLRAAAILSKAILQIGDKPVESEELTEEENQMRRFALYSRLIQTPPLLITDMYKFYLSVVAEEEAFYSASAKDINDKIEDFSTAPSEQ